MATQPVDVPFEEFTRAEWTALGGPTESRLTPTDVATLMASTVFDASAYQNMFTGTFGWNLDLSSKTLYLTYTPA